MIASAARDSSVASDGPDLHPVARSFIFAIYMVKKFAIFGATPRVRRMFYLTLLRMLTQLYGDIW